MKKSISIFFLVVFLTGCYHTSVVTGLEPSTTTIEQPFALSFVYGLVPPPEVDASEKCKDGVAKVETEISFVNGLVAALTFSLFTPMHITVTCAAPGGMAAVDQPEEQVITIPSEATSEEIQDIYKYASDLAVKYDKPVYIQK